MKIIPISLLGSGAMGGELLLHADRYALSVVSVFDVDTPFTEPNLTKNFSVAIDFTLPHLVLPHIQLAAKKGINVVIGTTGWGEHKENIRSIVEEYGIGVVYGSNFSIGMQMTFRAVKELATLLNYVDEYDVAIHEYHHTNKVDSPSGTGLSLASILVDSIDRKKNIERNTVQEKIAKDSLHITSTRLGSVVGKHIVTADSSFDQIEIIHNAKTRTGFALGALRAALWIDGKKGFFNFEDIFEETLQVND